MKIDENYYSKDKLKEKDRSEVEFWEDMIYREIDNALSEAEMLNDTVVGKMKYEAAAEFAETLTEYIRGDILLHITAIIDNYESSDCN